MLVRFIRCLIKGDSESPVQIGISLSCHTLISMSMYFFVFEMQAVKIQLQAKTLLEYDSMQRTNRRRKTVVMILSSIYGISYTTLRVMSAGQGYFNTAQETLYIPTFTLKLFLDFYVMVIFIITLQFFLEKRIAAFKKGAHATGFSKFNLFVLYSIYFLIFMRILGSIYTFIVGIVSMTSLFHDPHWELSYEILDDLVFPVRDFIEVLFFSYLFYFQSKRKLDLQKVNERWTETSMKRHSPR